MLRQEAISRIALGTSVFGIAMLLALAEATEPKQIKIGEIGNGMLDQEVKVNARIVSSYQRDGIAFLRLYDGTGKIKAVLFKPGNGQQALIGKNSFASFEGKVQLYKGELEIVVKSVKAWD